MRRISATNVIAALTVVVSVVLTLTGRDSIAAMLGGMVPARIVGAEFAPGTIAVPALLTPLSATLIHAGFAHLLLNMVVLLFAGNQLEPVLGPRALILLYVVGAYAAGAAQWLADPTGVTPMVGASGAISALMGAYSLLFGRSRAKAIGPIPAAWVHVLWLAAAWIGLNALLGIAFAATGVSLAVAAHIGGFLIGLALARPLVAWRWRKA